jgi:hypothetical protein
MSERPRWTAAEDDVLWFDTLAGIPHKLMLAHLPGRSLTAVRKQCSKLELFHRHLPRADRAALLRALWPDPSISTHEIADRLGITYDSVRRRANQLKLGSRPRGSRRRPGGPMQPDLPGLAFAQAAE